MPDLTVCADDFGLNTAVNEGVIQLVKAGRLNAVSCMAGGAAFAKGLPALIAACDEAPITVEIGLHLTFTQYAPLSPMKTLAPNGQLPSVGSLLIKSHLRLLRVEELQEEVQRQWHHFVAIRGRAPDFVDGHQHVHLLPQLREVVVQLVQAEFQGEGWVRSCHTDGAALRAQGLSSWRVRLISHLSTQMYRLLKEANIKTNPHFYGINDFNKNEDFDRLMQAWMSLAKGQQEWSVIMCHPGVSSPGGGVYDPIAARRVDEFEALSRLDFKDSLK